MFNLLRNFETLELNESCTHVMSTKELPKTGSKEAAVTFEPLRQISIQFKDVNISKN
jgi:hypothetical protein